MEYLDLELAERSEVGIESSKSLKDEDILALSVKRPDAFSMIVRKYRAPFMRKAKRILGSDDYAEDAVQEAFVKIYIKAGRFKPVAGASFQSWAYKILINTCFSMYKKVARERLAIIREDEEMFLNLPDIYESAAVEKRFNLDYFLSVASRLPQTLGTVLKHVVVFGRTPSEIARQEKLSVGAVRTRLHRAKQAFGKLSLKML